MEVAGTACRFCATAPWAIERVGLDKPVEMKSVSSQRPLGLVPFWVVERLLHSAATAIHLDVKQ